MSSAFQRIYEAITTHAPQLAPKNTHAIREWLASGYDLEKDILPAIEEAAKRGTRSIYSFGFFTPGIQRKHEQRIRDAATKPVIVDKQQQDAVRARNIKWHKIKGMLTTSIGPQDYEWLARFEQQHGEVVL